MTVEILRFGWSLPAAAIRDGYAATTSRRSSPRHSWKTIVTTVDNLPRFRASSVGDTLASLRKD